jgi:hypothetical protein
VGYSSAACGSDILFLEAMLDRRGEVVVVLPYEREQFIRDSVTVIPDSKWRTRFERVLEHATRVVTPQPNACKSAVFLTTTQINCSSPG